MSEENIFNPDYFNGNIISQNKMEFENATNKFSLPPVPRYIFNPYKFKLE